MSFKLIIDTLYYFPEGVRTFGSENGSSPSTSSLDYENLISDYTPEDWKNFSNLADNLPPIFTSQWIQRDGE